MKHLDLMVKFHEKIDEANQLVKPIINELPIEEQLPIVTALRIHTGHLNMVVEAFKVQKQGLTSELDKLKSQIIEPKGGVN